MRYRRDWTPGGTWFFTVNLADRSSRLLTEQVDVLRQSVRQVRSRHPFTIAAMVILPDHLHAIWTLPDGDSNYPVRWALIKSSFSRAVGRHLPDSARNARRRERGIWQRRYWEHRIRDERDFEAHVDYIHFNPVKHGHARRPVDWPYSSIHGYVRAGWLPEDWAVEPDEADRRFGEA